MSDYTLELESENETLRDTIAALLDQISDLENDNYDYKAELNNVEVQLSSEIEELIENLETVEKEKEELQSEFDEIQTDLKTAGNFVSGVIDDIMTICDWDVCQLFYDMLEQNNRKFKFDTFPNDDLKTLKRDIETQGNW